MLKDVISHFIVVLTICLHASSHACTWKDSPVRCHNGSCGVGQFYNVAVHSCQPCAERSYMAVDGHNCSSCQPCTEANPYNNEVVLNRCTEKSDTKLGCAPGYFRTVENRDYFHPEFSCWRCTSCKKGEKVIRKCTANANTECLPLKRFSTINPGVPVKESTQSGRGGALPGSWTLPGVVQDQQTVEQECFNETSKTITFLFNNHCTGLHIALVYTLHWSTHCTGLHIALVYTLHWTTHCTGLHIALVYTLYWSTHCTGLHIALANTLHWSTHCTGLHIALVYTLHWSTHCTGLYIALVYTLHWATHCTGIHIALDYTLHWSTHCTGLHIALDYTVYSSFVMYFLFLQLSVLFF
ncbi:hypothetical protein Btru_072106 [Bulinus truncatus]|nr:hypothetical protein Btru_072106 [Bulinus truncatus]